MGFYGGFSFRVTLRDLSWGSIGGLGFRLFLVPVP